jgi:hypothetical protein
MIVSGIKSQVMKPIFVTYERSEKWSRIFYFKILRDPSELLLDKKLARKAVLAWPVSCNSEGAHGISK